MIVLAKEVIHLKLKYLFFIISIFPILFNCEARVIDLNDDPMPDSLIDTEWVKADYMVHYGDLCLRQDFRIFDGGNNKFISKTIYDFNTSSLDDATIVKSYDVTFNTDIEPNRMKAVLESVTMNDVDVTGMEEVEIGNGTRNFPDVGDSLYYVFNNLFVEGDMETLILASDYNLYPEYIAVNQECYTKTYNTAITSTPDDFEATWKIASFRDRVKNTTFDQPFVEVKQRRFTVTTPLLSTMFIKVTYIFKDLPTEVYEYTFSLGTSGFTTVLGNESATFDFISVRKDGTLVNNPEDNNLGGKPYPLPTTGDSVSIILEHNGDTLKFTDIDGEIPPFSFDGTTYTLSNNVPVN